MVSRKYFSTNFFAKQKLSRAPVAVNFMECWLVTCFLLSKIFLYLPGPLLLFQIQQVVDGILAAESASRQDLVAAWDGEARVISK